MPRSPRLWSPVGTSSLAVPVRGNLTLEWDQYLNLLAWRVEELAKGEDNPEHVLEMEWLDQVGTSLHLSSKGVASVVDSPVFEELLAEKYNLRPSDFPMETGRQSIDEGEPQNLVEWVQYL